MRWRVLLLSLVILAAAGYTFYWYRRERQEYIPSGTIPRIKWTKRFGNEHGFSTSPVLGKDGTLYLAGTRGDVFALDPSSAVQWQYHLPEFVVGGLILDDGSNLYVTTLTKVFSLTDSGRKRWETACSGSRMWQDELGSTLDHNALYTECGKNFTALNKTNGQQIWTWPPLDSESAPVVLKDGVIAFVSGRQLFAVNRDGRALWNYPRDSALTYDPRLAGNSPPQIWVDNPIAVGSDGTLYVGSRMNQRFLAFAPNGTVKWAFDVGMQPFRSSPVIAADGTIIAVTMQQLLYAFTPDGMLKWTFQLPTSTNAGLHAAPVLGSDGTIYMLSEQKLIALSPEGKTLWELPLPGAFGGSPALSPNGTLYAATFQGTVYAVQTASRGLMQSAWPRYQHDSSNSGRSDGAN
jgi:outer membrane protein assembly factor BamB